MERLAPVTIKPGESESVQLTFYSGPKLNGNLSAVNDTLDLTIDYGWLWFFSSALVEVLRFFFRFTANWGFAIICVTISLKLLFLPLTYKSSVSMARTKRVQPKLEALREIYADNKEELSRKTMELYRKEKVNPLGGCLPILFQIPIFIAFYWMLQESIELRQAPFILWVEDLSVKDPYFILPLTMGLLMFLQQKLNPAMANNPQMKMMQWMPLVFTAMFLWFPAGLTLYWTVNNFLTLLQQQVIMRILQKRMDAQAKTHR